MRLLLQDLSIPTDASFRTFEFREINFEYPLHVHPEYEFTYFIKGRGIQVVGDNVSSFSDHSLLFVGPNLPHAWRTEQREKRTKTMNHAVNLHFKENFLGEGFFDKPEMYRIKQVLEKSRFGLEITGATNHFIGERLVNLKKKKEFDRILVILDILHALSRSSEYHICSSLGYLPGQSSQKEMDRIKAIHQYILDHYTHAIKLEQIARVGNMTSSAFCHYFKKRTGKPFIQFVNELRIRQASSLLKETTLCIADVCYESGFKNLSNFNRCFKKALSVTPCEYRRTFDSSGALTRVGSTREEKEGLKPISRRSPS